MAKVDLEKEISKVLAQFGDDVNKNLGEITKAIGKKGAQAVSANSPAVSGDYAAGWMSKFEARRTGAMATIYNKAKPGLAHLLENGHANVDGGFTPGRPHIKPVEEEISEEFERKVINDVTGY